MPGSGFKMPPTEEIRRRWNYGKFSLRVARSSFSPGGGACPFQPLRGGPSALSTGRPAPCAGSWGSSRLSSSFKPWLPWERRRGPLWSITHAPGTRPMDNKLRNAANQSAGSPDGLPRLLPPMRTKTVILVASVERDFIIFFKRNSSN